MKNKNIWKKIIRVAIFIGLLCIIGNIVADIYILYASGKIHLPFQKSAASCKDCNIILVSLDTLSANHLPCYGYSRNTSPNLCAFAKDNIFFENMHANAPWTVPSHVSIFTGLYPYTHNVNIPKDTLSETTQFLPAVLQDAGYQTMFVLPYANPSMPMDKVYNRGIDKFYNEYDIPSWFSVLDEFKNNVTNNKKTFLFLHTYFVHTPYVIENRPMLYKANIIKEIPIEESTTLEITDDVIIYIQKHISGVINSGDFSNEDVEKFKRYKLFIDQNGQNPELCKKYTREFRDAYSAIDQLIIEATYFSKIDKRNPEHVEYIKALYDQRINELDNSYIKELVDFYNSNSDIQKNTVIIITADHGEEFMEHGQILHETLYDSNTRVPLIIAFPKVKQKTVTIPAQSVDIAPTILDIIGVPATSPFQGISLISGILGKQVPDRMLIADGYNLGSKSIRWGDWKLFLSMENENMVPYEMYDYKNDPSEKNNILFSNLDIAKQIIQKYQEYTQEWNNQR